MVKIAHRFLTENSQNWVDPRGCRLGSYPLISYASPRGSVVLAISQRIIQVFSLVGARCSDWARIVFPSIFVFLTIFPFNFSTHAFISVVPSVWHIFRACVWCYCVILPCLSIWLLSATETWPLRRSEELLLVHFGLFVCPPWYLMSYCRCWVYYPGMYFIFCCFESVTGRTHLHRHYRTFFV